MALNIKNEEADRLARDLAELTGESLTDAVIESLRERLERESGRVQHYGVREDVTRIQQRVAKLPRLDDRSDDEIIGYDEAGLPD
ncbi:MAG TPA: type II toxin-antitoxin system VapB family antitoxin [Rhodothermales bacterium]|nr:type II toxin-antitoxin system VapB family antitoxin [Rhodothermales bacterium]